MSPDTTPRDEIAAWLASPEVDDLVARVESRLDKPTARLCDDLADRLARPRIGHVPQGRIGHVPQGRIRTLIH